MRYLLLAVPVTFTLACEGPRVGADAGAPDAGSTDAATADASVDAGTDAGPAPEDRVFSLGLYDDSGGPPQTAAVLRLAFGRDAPSPDRIVAARVSTPPVIDADGGDWAGIAGSTVALVGPGPALGLTRAEWDGLWLDAGLSRAKTGKDLAIFDFGIASADVKAAFDDAAVYFLVSWADATENRLREEWSFDGGAWERSRNNEDRLVMSFEIGGSFPPHQTAGCAAACHVKERLGDVTPAGLAHRFDMHTSDAGEKLDVWHWKATRSNPLGFADDQYIDSVRRRADDPTDFVQTNQRAVPDAGPEPAFMAAGGVNANVDYVFTADAGTPTAVPFDGTGALPGARIPGYVHQLAGPARAHITARGAWRAGRWTVELRRALTTNDLNDVQFPLR